MMVIAGAVVGGGAGTFVELPPPDVFGLGRAREDKAQNQSKRCQTSRFLHITASFNKI
jgi:hypothetical protein